MHARWIVPAGLLVATMGCREPMAPTGPTVARVVVADEAQFEHLWETTADVLRAHNLWPDRQDRAARVITTFPDTSPSWFEFWRPFPSSDFGRLEANVQTVRRQAEVRFAPVEAGQEYEMSVRVDVERYNLLERQATDAASAFQMFGAKLPTVEGRTEPRQSGAYWSLLGRDEAMELALLDRILRRYGGGSSPTTTQPAEP